MNGRLDLRPHWLNRRLAHADGRGIRVAVVDSGYDGRCRPGNVKKGVGWDGRADPPLVKTGDDADIDRIGHGTAVCDAVLALAPGVEIFPLKVFRDRLETSPGAVVAAVDWAVERGIEVVNLSLGSRVATAAEPFDGVCRRAREAGTVVVSAIPLGVGRVYPGSFDHVLGVSAGRFDNAHDLDMPSRTSEPPDAPGVDFIAHGGRKVTWRGEVRSPFGASMAAPHLSALVALVRERFPKADPEGVHTLLGELAAASRAARHLED